MRKQLFLILTGFIISAMIVSASFAEFVYVTQNGKKYHHVDSRFSKYKNAEKITLEEAEERGYEPSRNYLKRVASLEVEKKGQAQEGK